MGRYGEFEYKGRMTGIPPDMLSIRYGAADGAEEASTLEERAVARNIYGCYEMSFSLDGKRMCFCYDASCGAARRITDENYLNIEKDFETQEEAGRRIYIFKHKNWLDGYRVYLWL